MKLALPCDHRYMSVRITVAPQIVIFGLPPLRLGAGKRDKVCLLQYLYPYAAEHLRQLIQLSHLTPTRLFYHTRYSRRPRKQDCFEIFYAVHV